jgi:hypothetical protein
MLIVHVDSDLKDSERPGTAELMAAIEQYVAPAENDWHVAFRALVERLEESKDAGAIRGVSRHAAVGADADAELHVGAITEPFLQGTPPVTLGRVEDQAGGPRRLCYTSASASHRDVSLCGRYAS